MKADLKLNIQKTKIMASSSITSWKIEGEKVEAVTDLLGLPYPTLNSNKISHVPGHSRRKQQALLSHCVAPF